MKPRHIHTLTGNLLAEHIFTFAAWEPGRTQRAAGASFQAGGKGINVARMLRRLGMPATALTFAGGETGAACVGWLTRAGLDLQVFASAQPTRTGLVVRADGRAETTFLGPDTPPGPTALADCAAYLAAQPDGEILAVCGSFPGWSGADYDPLRSELARWARRGCLVVDSYGPPLAWLVTQPLALVKINADEFRSLLGDPADLPAALQSVRTRCPVPRWIVTSGPGEVWFLDGDRPPDRMVPPVVREVSATGSGDVLFAAVIEGWAVRGLSLGDTLAEALTLAAANAAHPGIAEFPLPPRR